jgi:hypothetical protein
MSAATSTTQPFRWYISVAVVLLIFAVIAYQSTRVAQDTTTYDQDQAKIRLEKLEKLRAADEKTLTTADWVDKDKGIVRIPIDEAMSQEVALLKAKPVAMGVEIPGAVAPAPAAPAAPAAPSTPATNAAPTGMAPASTNAPTASTNAAPTEP